MVLRAALVIALVVSVLACAPALACPNCPTSRLVATIVCGDGWWRNVAAVVSPFIVWGAVAWRLNRIDGGRPAPSTLRPRPEEPS